MQYKSVLYELAIACSKATLAMLWVGRMKNCGSIPDSRQTFLLSKRTKPFLESTLSLDQCTQGALSLGVKWLVIS